VISDLEAIKAIDRLCRAAPRNLDLEALRVWIAAHCGLNPHAAKPLDPDAPLVAERDKLSAKVADLQDKLAAAAARLQDLESRNRELKDKLAGAKNDAKRERAERLEAGKPIDKDPDSPANKRKAARNEYQRELMRKRRAGKAAKTSPADTADNAATPADNTAADVSPSG
jgi:peptidoglycan hydrolase CwlO-like protein